MILEPKMISIDMIDLVIDLSPHEFEMMIKPIADIFNLDEHLEYWESFGWNKYRHNWCWSQDEGNEKYNFFFSYCSNISEDLKTRFRVSYNPNKVPHDDRVLSYLIHILRFEEKQLRIQSFDVAFDYYGITTSDLIFDKGRKKEFKVFGGYSHSDDTYYIGSKGSGQIKIYDKANEETKHKKEKADYSKTRYEISVCETLEYRNLFDWVYKSEIPTVYITQVKGLYDNKDYKENDKLLLYSVEQGYPLHKLTYRKRQRYKQLMSDIDITYTKIEPSRFAVETTLKEFILNLIY